MRSEITVSESERDLLWSCNIEFRELSTRPNGYVDVIIQSDDVERAGLILNEPVAV